MGFLLGDEYELGGRPEALSSGVSQPTSASSLLYTWDILGAEGQCHNLEKW